jgi:hypothetical protein
VTSKFAVRAFSECVRQELAEDPKREVTDRRFGRMLELAVGIAPPVWSRLAPRLFGRLALGKRPAPNGYGNLVEPRHDP